MIKGDRLRKLRIEKGLTQKELSNILGLDKSSICCYEKNTRNPSLESILDLINLFGVSADYLFGVDKIVAKDNSEDYNYIALTKEEIMFIEELRKNKLVYKTLLENPKRGVEIIKIKVG